MRVKLGRCACIRACVRVCECGCVTYRCDEGGGRGNITSQRDGTWTEKPTCEGMRACVRVCVRVCVLACMRACVRV